MSGINNNNNIPTTSRKSPSRKSPRREEKVVPPTNEIKSLDDIIVELVVKFILNCPEEEHENFDRLFFQIEEAFWFYLDFYREQNTSLPKLNLHQFADKVFIHCPDLQPFQQSVDAHIQSFISYKTSVPVCGIVLIDENLENILLVKGWNSKSWSFPRGKINKDEEESACAIREGREEIGFDCSPYIMRDQILEGQFNEQLVKLFIAPFIPSTTKFCTQTRKEIAQIAWFNINDIIKKQARGNFWPVKPFLSDLHNWVHKFKSGNKLASLPKKQTPSSPPRTPPKQISRISTNIHVTPFEKHTPSIQMFQRKQPSSPQNTSPAISYTSCDDNTWLTSFSFTNLV
jgi:mRNA-decapping enzyme subunit 2